MDNSERIKQLAEAVQKVRDGNAFQVPMGMRATKAMLEKHLRQPTELEIANRLDDDGDAQAASVIRRQHAELTRLRDFARSVNESREQEPVAWASPDSIANAKMSIDPMFHAYAIKLPISGDRSQPLYAAPVPAQPAVPEVVAYRINWPQCSPTVTTSGAYYEQAKRLGVRVDWLGVIGGIDAAPAASLSTNEGRKDD